MRSFLSGGYRATLTVLGLVVVVVLLAALAWEAAAAARAQRQTVEAVLRDYAQIAAEQYARSVEITIDYDWLFAVRQRIDFAEGQLRAPETGDQIRTQTGKTLPVTALAETFFAGVVGANALVGARDWPAPRMDDAMRGVLENQLPMAVAEDWPIAATLHEGGEGERLIVFWVARDSRAEETIVAGFDAPLTGFETVLRQGLGEYTVLPAPFTEGSGGDLVAVRVLTAGGRVLFESGPPFYPRFSASVPIGPRLGDLVVQAAIPALSAEHLVIGGLPRSRVPEIVTMLVVAVGLLTGGVLLLRQERELMRVRERFVAGASHELRTPLAQIRLFAETLRLDRVRSTAERDRSLEILDREALRLSYLVENLLHFSRSTAQESLSTPRPMDLLELARDVIEGFAPLAAARDARVDLSARGAATVLAERDAMRQVLLNMLDNATKYGPEGQTVTVGVGELEGGRVALSVDDQGPGIPPGDRARVWDRFWRGGDVDGTTGTGIGLSLVKELVESNGGEVSVEDAPGGGARFQVIFPGVA